MKRSALYMAIAALALVMGFAAHGAATAQIDPGKFQRKPGIKPLKPNPGLMHVQCARQFSKQISGRNQKSYDCNFAARKVCAPGTVPGRAVMRERRGMIYVSYPCLAGPD